MFNLLLDVDNVLLDWIGAFRTWLNKYHNIHLPQRLKSYELNDIKDVDVLIKKFNQTEYVHNLDPIKNSYISLYQIHKELHINEIVCITAFCGDQEKRVKNLQRCYGDLINDVIFTGNDKSSAFILYAHPAWNEYPSLWLDDKYENYRNGKKFGFYSHLMRYSYNEHYNIPNNESVIDWKDFYNKVRKIYESI